MPSLETFVHKKLHITDPSVLGPVVEFPVAIDQMLSTHPYLIQKRYEGVKRRASRMIPDVINCIDAIQGVDEFYVIDGHHKSRRAYDMGETHFDSRVLITEIPEIRVFLSTIAHGLIIALDIEDVWW